MPANLRTVQGFQSCPFSCIATYNDRPFTPITFLVMTGGFGMPKLLLPC